MSCQHGMLGQICVNNKTVPTHFTNIWLFPCVCSKMSCETVGEVERSEERKLHDHTNKKCMCYNECIIT